RTNSSCRTFGRGRLYCARRVDTWVGLGKGTPPHPLVGRGTIAPMAARTNRPTTLGAALPRLHLAAGSTCRRTCSGTRSLLHRSRSAAVTARREPVGTHRKGDAVVSRSDCRARREPPV